MLNIKIMGQQFKRLTMIYDKNWDDEKFKFKLSEYYKQLKMLSDDAFIEGVDKAINQYDRFPTIHELKGQCNVQRGRKEHTTASIPQEDTSILDEMFNGMDGDEKNYVKKLAFQLMKAANMIPEGYKKGANKWHDGMIQSTFNCSFKYIVLRKYFHEEVKHIGYKLMGEARNDKLGWCTFEQCFNIR